MIETESNLGMGKIGEPIDAYLVLDIDYAEWWATQTCSPLVGPVEGEVSLFIYFYFYLYITLFFICWFI